MIDHDEWRSAVADLSEWERAASDAPDTMAADGTRL